MKRVFMGIRLTGSLNQVLDEYCERLQIQLPAETLKTIQWVCAENRHLTLRFLGDVTSGQIAELKMLMSSSVQTWRDCGVSDTKTGLSLNIKAIEQFPQITSRYLVASMANCLQLSTLVSELQRQLAGRDLDQADNPRYYRPHITLANWSDNLRVGNDLQTLLKGNNLHLQSTLGADCIELYESHQGPNGSSYRSLLSVPLIS